MICNWNSPVPATVPALKIDRFLAAQGDFQPVIAKAREIDALSKLLQDFLPPELSSFARVANFKDGKLTVHAANGPVAAKLKLLSEELAACITKQRGQVNSVSVRVQPETGRNSSAATHKSSLLSGQALGELEALHARVPDSPFRAALKALLARRGIRV